MTVGSIFLGFALLLLVGLFVARPFLKPKNHPTHGPARQRALLIQKEAKLNQIRDLDLDYETGKVTEVDYQRVRAGYLVEATALLKQLDALNESTPEAGMDEKTEDAVLARDVDDLIEAAIARRRSRQEHDIPVRAPAKAARSRNGRTNYCPECGTPTDPGDKFCAHCGRNLLQPHHA